MAAKNGAPVRVADALFRRDMLGPTFGHMAASATGLLLFEKLTMEYIVPYLAPTLATYQASMGRLGFMMAGAFMSGIASYWIIGGLFALPAIFHVEKWKIQVNKSCDVKALASAMPLTWFNFLTGTIIYVFCMVYFLPDSAFNLTELPSTGTLARDVVVWMVLQETSFFYVHKFFHENKQAYKMIHKLHHTWPSPVSLVAMYCHPVEHIVANVGPLLIGPMLCRSHTASITVFLFLGLVHTTAVHSGYWICDDNGMHDEHHAKFNVNYGVSGVLDVWYGTYRLPEGAVASGEAQQARKAQ